MKSLQDRVITRRNRQRVFAGFTMILLILLFAGCVPVYTVQVNGYADSAVMERLAPNARICILGNPGAENPIFDQEIKLKIEKLLKSRGFTLSNAETADYLGKFNYGIGTGITRIGTIPIQSPPVTSTVAVPHKGGSTYTAITTPGPTTYVPYARTAYDRWLNIAILDAKFFRDTKQDKVLWYGEIISSGSSRDLRTVLNYMLVVALEELGKDTRKGIIKEIKENDERIRALLAE